MERCKYCGAPLEYGARFCKNCVQYIDTVHLPVPPQVSPGPHVPMLPGSPSGFNGPTVQTVPGFNGAYVRGAVSSPTPAPTVATSAPLTPPIAGRLFAPMPPFPPRTNHHGPSGPTAQEQPYVPGSHLLPGETGPTIPDEARRLYEQMRYLAEQFLELFKAIPQADRKYRLSGKPSQGLVKSEVIVYKGPSTQEEQSDPLPLQPRTVIRVFAEKPGQVSPSGHVWYRISRRFAKPRYISAGPVINLYQMLQRYFRLATKLWEAVAADRLEELACDKAYTDDVEELEKQLKFLQERYPKALEDTRPDIRVQDATGTSQESAPNNMRNAKASGNEKLPWRIRLYQRALHAWLDCMGEDTSSMLSDPTECGRILYHARGYLGLGSCNWFNYALIESTRWLNVLCLPVFLICFAVSFPLGGSSAPPPIAITVSLVILLVSIYLLGFSVSGTSLPLMMGYALTRKPRSGDAAQPGPGSKASYISSDPFQRFYRTCAHILRKLWNMSHRFLRFWLFYIGGVCLPFSLIRLLPAIFSSPCYCANGIALIDAVIALTSLLFIVVVLCISLPFSLTMQIQMSRELIAHPRRPPKARRCAVRPAMKLLSFHTIIFLVIAIAVLNSVPAFRFREADVSLGFLPTFNIVHQVVYVLVVALLYVGFLEIPYRWGLRRWKTHRLVELAGRRQGFDQRLRQRSTALAEEKESASIQDDYTRWQYYRTLEEDVNRTPPGPFSLIQQGWAFLIALAPGTLIPFIIEFIKNMHPN